MSHLRGVEAGFLDLRVFPDALSSDPFALKKSQELWGEKK